jgi:hypothetical protein
MTTWRHRLAWMAATALVVFLATYIPMRLQCASESRQRQQAEARLQVARSLVYLGATLDRVSEQNYGLALREAGRFFDALHAMPPSIVPSDTIQALYQMRDRIIGDLNTLNPDVSRTLWGLYRRLLPYASAEP